MLEEGAAALCADNALVLMIKDKDLLVIVSA